MRTGALIVAAGHKSSISPFGPMLPIGNSTVIRRIIITLKQAGIEPVVLITGRQGEELEKHVSKLRVISLRNEAYEHTHMYDSICMGLNYIEELCDRVLVLPAKFPMLLPNTISEILECTAPVVCPVFDGRRGHPVLISAEIIPRLLDYSGDNGLRGALRRPEIDCLVREVQVEDQGIIQPVENEEDCKTSHREKERIPLHPNLQLYLECDEPFFGPSMAQFLQLIDHTGSMQTACRQMHMSYTKGWKLLKAAEMQLGYPLLITQSGGAEGGSSKLSPKTREFLNRYLAMEKELDEEAKHLFRKHFPASPARE